GVNEDYFFHNVNADLTDTVFDTIRKLVNISGRDEMGNVQTVNDARDTYAMTMVAEAIADHQHHYIQMAEDSRQATRSELYFGESLSAVDYLHAQNIREQVRREFKYVFKKVDVLISPTVPFVAPTIGECNVRLNGKEVPFSEHVSRLIRPTTL